jgi:hypothetical protein
MRGALARTSTLLTAMSCRNRYSHAVVSSVAADNEDDACAGAAAIMPVTARIHSARTGVK